MDIHQEPVSLREQLLIIAHAFAEASGHKSLKRASTLVFSDWKTFDRLERGGDLTTGSFERAMRWFSTNWPEGVEWPAGIERPLQDEKPTEEPQAPESDAAA